MMSSWLRENALPEAQPQRVCLCCGQCCESFGGHLQASQRDLERWRELGREDLLRRVSSIGWIWINPDTGTLEDRCPFLRRTGPETQACAIHDVKPDICRDYPTLAHGRQCLRGVFLGLIGPILLAVEEVIGATLH